MTTAIIARGGCRRLAALSVLGFVGLSCGGGGGRSPRDAEQDTQSGATDGGTSAEDSAMADGPGTDAADATTLPVGVWTWVPVAGSLCGNGTPAGVGVNPTADRESLLIYLFGGGACWDANTCFVVRSAARIDETYGTGAFNTDVGALNGSGLFNRADAANPFAAASWVFVPYCTGDLHFGHVDRTYNPLEPARVVHHRGGDNIDLFLQRLARDFAAVKTIWLTGSSAGGYGAAFNFDRVAAAFPGAAVHLLADSAQQITPGQGRWPVMRDAWALTFPAGCAGCADALPVLMDFLATKYPQRRLGLLAYDQDQTIANFWGYSGAEVQTLTSALITNQYVKPNTKYFLLGGTKHVLLGEYNTLTAAGGITLKTWVAQWATGDAAWTSVR